jgi:chitinase
MYRKIALPQIVAVVCMAVITNACEKGKPDFIQPVDKRLPTVKLVVDRSFIVSGGTAAITATAEDNEPLGSGVAKVEFYNGTQLLATDSSAPYTYTFTGGADYTKTTITAKAFDRAKNASEPANAVTVSVGKIIEAETGVLVKAPGSGAFWITRADGNKHYGLVNEDESGADIPVNITEAGNYVIALVAATGWADPVTVRFAANNGAFQQVSIPRTDWEIFGTYQGATAVALTAGLNTIKVRKGQWYHHLDAIFVAKN